MRYHDIGMAAAGGGARHRIGAASWRINAAANKYRESEIRRSGGAAIRKEENQKKAAA